jgi:hypothetical protein
MTGLLGGLFASGHIVDCVLLFMIVEAMVLILIHKSQQRGIAPLDLLVSLAAGCALLLALRGALTDSGWPVIAACLLLALIAHLFDLLRRWRPSDARRG